MNETFILFGVLTSMFLIGLFLNKVFIKPYFTILTITTIAFVITLIHYNLHPDPDSFIIFSIFETQGIIGYIASRILSKKSFRRLFLSGVLGLIMPVIIIFDDYFGQVEAVFTTLYCENFVYYGDLIDDRQSPSYTDEINKAFKIEKPSLKSNILVRIYKLPSFKSETILQIPLEANTHIEIITSDSLSVWDDMQQTTEWGGYVKVGDKYLPSIDSNHILKIEKPDNSSLKREVANLNLDTLHSLRRGFDDSDSACPVWTQLDGVSYVVEFWKSGTLQNRFQFNEDKYDDIRYNRIQEIMNNHTINQETNNIM
jgi:hypothetical protein